MARPGRPERNKAARSFRQIRRFLHVINSNKVFGTHSGAFARWPGSVAVGQCPTEDTEPDNIEKNADDDHGDGSRDKATSSRLTIGSIDAMDFGAETCGLPPDFRLLRKAARAAAVYKRSNRYSCASE